jgi:prepilin-type N-terminal cleavage/methylation domain-containing protein
LRGKFASIVAPKTLPLSFVSSPDSDSHPLNPSTSHQHHADSHLNRLNSANAAFTLIEMVVVILIIGTLAALLMGAATSAFDRARKTQAKNDVTQLVTAINAFYTEYGRYPVNVTNTANDAFFGTGTAPAGCTSYGNNDVLVDVLRNNTTGNNAALVTSLNPRQIVFFSPSGAKNTTPPRGGVVGSGFAGAGQYYDPWGSQYAILIDTNYDNTITNPYSDTDGGAGLSPLRVGAGAYSFGKNGKLGGGAAAPNTPFAAEGGSANLFKGSSDIYSW